MRYLAMLFMIACVPPAGTVRDDDQKIIDDTTAEAHRRKLAQDAVRARHVVAPPVQQAPPEQHPAPPPPDPILEAQGNTCHFLEQRTQAKDAIARERANGAGVVDLNALHAWGALLSEANEGVRNWSARYRELAGRPFDPKACE